MLIKAVFKHVWVGKPRRLFSTFPKLHSTTKSAISNSCPYVDLHAVLAKHLERLATKLLNEPRIVKIPTEEHKVAVKTEYQELKRRNLELPVSINNQVINDVVKYGTQPARIRLFRNIAISERERDEKLAEKLDLWQKRFNEKIDQIKDTIPDFEPKDGMYLKDGSYVLGPPMCLHKKWNVALALGTYEQNLLFALRFGQNFVIDLGFTKGSQDMYKMEGKEITSIQSQMKEVFRLNRSMWEPYNIYLCNYDEGNETVTSMVNGLKGYTMHVTSQCFTEVLPKDKLVYLSPDSPNILNSYSHDDIYILGALVDKRMPRAYTYRKALSLGIRSAKFNLQPFEFTRQKKPYFAFSDVFQILADLKDTNGNWMYAYRNLLSGRKRIVKFKEEYEEDAAPHSRPEDYDFKFKCFENHRSLVKPQRKDVKMIMQDD